MNGVLPAETQYRSEVRALDAASVSDIKAEPGSDLNICFYSIIRIYMIFDCIDNDKTETADEWSRSFRSRTEFAYVNTIAYVNTTDPFDFVSLYCVFILRNPRNT